ncbi:hypothetical protein BSD967_10435 [Bifidobacterium saguini]|uniref:Transposase n=2 Tax=Bifidobacterium saguini TaxID=762210 RepID=A0ABX7SCZ6_9BIFI|nr:hypothetical protein [Bifidobacterium saguini]QTB90695.1 hypothetical protein BSD967_10435 [Bifidobacterium saguini]
MGGELDERTVDLLLSNCAVLDVRNGRIHYASWFRSEVIRRRMAGEGLVSIFRSQGLGPELIGYKRIERCWARWNPAHADPSVSPRHASRRTDRQLAMIADLRRRVDALEAQAALGREAR